MPNESSRTYAEQKIDYLKQSVRVTEDLLSCISDEKKILAFLAERNDIFTRLTELDQLASETNASCSKSELAKIDQLVDLLLKLDGQAEKNIKEELQATLAAMKTNVKEHKFIGYKDNPNSPTGNFLDTKR